MERLVYKEQADGREYKGSQPHAGKGGHDILFDESFAEIVQQEEDDEKDNGKDQRQADPSFADNRTQWSTDQEHNKAGH
jgi:hypothetical protein